MEIYSFLYTKSLLELKLYLEINLIYLPIQDRSEVASRFIKNETHDKITNIKQGI